MRTSGLEFALSLFLHLVGEELVGRFAIGRLVLVVRQFLSYAAEVGSPLYGAGTMMVQGAGQALLMIVLFALSSGAPNPGFSGGRSPSPIPGP